LRQDSGAKAFANEWMAIDDVDIGLSQRARHRLRLLGIRVGGVIGRHRRRGWFGNSGCSTGARLR
jgi:hypothetical protein